MDQQEEFQQSLIINLLQHSALRLYLNDGSALLANHTSEETILVFFFDLGSVFHLGSGSDRGHNSHPDPGGHVGK